MEIIINLLIMLCSSLVILKSVNLFINSSTKIAKHFKLSGYTISFLLIGMATSFPEWLLAFTSGIKKKSILTYGDALGSNIALLTLLTAIPGLMGSGLHTKKIFKSKDVYFAILFALLGLALSMDKVIGRIDGLFLILGYLVYAVAFLRRSSTLEQIVTRLTDNHIWKQIGMFALSLVLLLLSSQGIFWGANSLAEALDINIVLIGLTLTALGTSTPELAYIIKQGIRGNEEEVVGDIVGSVVANITVILGTAAIISPIRLSDTYIGISTFMFLVLALCMFYVFSKTKGKVDKFESVILLITYILFIMAEVYLKGK